METAEDVENILKKISDQLESINPTADESNRIILGVMRVGDFAQGKYLKIGIPYKNVFLLIISQ